jgi:outer membrane lipoprotein-sorting protein
MIAVFSALILMTSLCSCGEKSQHGVYQEIYKRYNNMESFYAEAEVTVRSDKTESVYMVRQFYESPDKFSLMVDSPETVAGSGYTAKDGVFLLKSGFGQTAECEAAFPEEKNVMFLCDFFDEYYKSEEIFVRTNGALAGDTTTLTCFLPGKNEKRFMQSLKIDNKTYLPLVLETYDIDKKPVVTVKYGEFKRNCDIDEKIFD